MSTVLVHELGLQLLDSFQGHISLLCVSWRYWTRLVGHVGSDACERGLCYPYEQYIIDDIKRVNYVILYVPEFVFEYLGNIVL